MLLGGEQPKRRCAFCRRAIYDRIKAFLRQQPPDPPMRRDLLSQTS